jgi:hypothetical protein
MSDDEEEVEYDELEQIMADTCDLIDSLLKDISEVESKLNTLQRPLQHLHVDQLGDLEFLEKSSFRSTPFLFAKPGPAKLAGLDVSKRHSYKTIVGCLRNAILQQCTVDENGLITLTPAIQKMLETKEKKITFPGLLGYLRNVLL